MYEHKKQPVATTATFHQRILKNILIALFIMAVCLAIGVAGYHYTDNIPWIDAVHNASMILSGMGPVVEIKSEGGKLFSSAYALFSGVVFLGATAVLLSPVYHRVLHRFHLLDDGEEQT